MFSASLLKIGLVLDLESKELDLGLELKRILLFTCFHLWSRDPLFPVYFALFFDLPFHLGCGLCRVQSMFYFVFSTVPN
jgi:hypothetical protein